MNVSPNRPVQSIFVICNKPAAADAELREAVELVRAEGLVIEVREVHEPHTVSSLAAEAARAGVDAVVAAGGDGTLNEVVNGVHAAGRLDRCGVGVLPFGTANDFAAGCGIPLEQPLAALRLIAEGNTRPIDVGRVNDRLFVNVASGGAAAEVTTETSPEAKRLLGGFAYLLTGLSNVFEPSPWPVRVQTDDFDWQGQALALLIANGRQAGGGFQIARQARLDDGLLNLCIIPEISLDELAALVGDWMQPDHADHELLIKREISWLEVAAPEGFQINLDGEPIRDDFFRIDALPGQLQFFLPPGAPLNYSSRFANV